MKSNGSYVEPHYRTAPNSTNTDNFSTIPNINPHTLVPGYISPDSNSNNKNYLYATPENANNNDNSANVNYKLSEIEKEISDKYKRLIENSTNQTYPTDSRNNIDEDNPPLNYDPIQDQEPYIKENIDSSSLLADTSIVNISTAKKVITDLPISKNYNVNSSSESKNYDASNSSFFIVLVCFLFFVFMLIQMIVDK